MSDLLTELKSKLSLSKIHEYYFLYSCFYSNYRQPNYYHEIGGGISCKKLYNRIAWYLLKISLLHVLPVGMSSSIPWRRQHRVVASFIWSFSTAVSMMKWCCINQKYLEKY